MKAYFESMRKGYLSRNSAYQMVDYIDTVLLPMIDSGASKEEVLNVILKYLGELTLSVQPITANNIAEQSLNFSTRLYLRDYIDHLRV